MYVLLFFSSSTFAENLGSILDDFDPLATLPVKQLEEVLAQIEPLQFQATSEQKYKIALLRIRHLSIKGDYADALNLFHALEPKEMPPAYSLRAYDLAIQITSVTGKYLEAFTYLKKVQKLMNQLDSPSEKYAALSSAAHLFSKAGDLGRALNMATQALYWAEQGKDETELCVAWNILGDVQVENGLFDEAESSFKKNLEFARKNDLVLFQGAAIQSMGDIQKERGNFEQAITYYLIARPLMQSVEYLESVWQIELGLAESYFELKDFPSALALVEPLLPKLILADHLPGKIQVYQLLSRLAHARGEADSALDWYIKYDSAKEEQAKSNKAITMAYHQVEFDTKVMEHQISLLEEKNRRMITEGKLEEQKKMFFLLGFVAVLITSILLTLLLFRSIRDKREFKRLSQLDPLTGLYNHERTYELGVRAFKSCLNNNIPFAVAIADIDHFKQVNDTYGHATGDEVLKALTKHMNDHFTGDCIVGRTGGEEFSLFMPGKTREEAEKWIGEFQQILRLEAFFGKVIEITMSFGLAVARPEQILLNLVIRDADTALYKAKNKGRNRLEIYKEQESALLELTTDKESVTFLD